MLDTTSLLLLLGTCAVSFVVGRTIVHFRSKKRSSQIASKSSSSQSSRRLDPNDVLSTNKGKRRRALQQLKKAARDGRGD